MQELRSTQVLDKQIHDEAVKKVQSILEKTELDCKSIQDSVLKEVADSKQLKEEVYKKKYESVIHNYETTLPLEKKRLKLSFINACLINAINEYVFSLKEEERINILINDLNKKILPFKNINFNVFVYGFNLEKVKSILEKQFKNQIIKIQKTEFGKLILEDEIQLTKQEGFILESEDKSLRLRITLCNLLGSILQEHREKLYGALFGSNLDD